MDVDVNLFNRSIPEKNLERGGHCNFRNNNNMKPKGLKKIIRTNINVTDID